MFVANVWTEDMAEFGRNARLAAGVGKTPSRSYKMFLVQVLRDHWLSPRPSVPFSIMWMAKGRGIETTFLAFVSYGTRNTKLSG